jgi:aspartokinase/homoserine dehydrogenase 1
MSILAAVGDNLVRTRGIAARFFGAMARAGVNINAIAQGSSERNISAVIDTSDSTRALRAVHTDFHLSDEVISLGLIGPGLIGKTLLRQLEAQAPRLKEVQQLDFQVRGICGSREMLCGDRGLVSSDWEAEQDRRPVDMEEFVRHIRAGDSPHTILVDCTASDDVAGRYSEWLERRCHIVTPNKKANSSSKELYSALRQLADRQNVHFLYEATVGAGLPVIATLRELLNTGDEVLRIEGVLSGTLSYIFNSLSPGESFAGVVQRARDLGYTEPDPRDDLSGMDVARKLIILARECGCEIELDDVDVETMVPEALRETSVDGFLERLGEFDTDLGRRCEAAAAEGRCLRYVGVHDATTGRCSAGLEAYPNSHPFARLDSSCNLFGFTTNRYREMPLYVQGPGAGPDVTAAGVFGDLLRLAARLRRPLPHTLADRDD